MTDRDAKDWQRSTAADWAHEFEGGVSGGLTGHAHKMADKLSEAYTNDIISNEYAEAQFELSKRVLALVISRIEPMFAQIEADLEGPDADALMDAALTKIKAEGEAIKAKRDETADHVSDMLKDLMDGLGIQGEVIHGNRQEMEAMVKDLISKRRARRNENETVH